MTYTYTFSAWPDEFSPRMKACPAVFKLFRQVMRMEQQFTERKFNDFREQLAQVGITLREIERFPYHEPEVVR